MLIRTLVFVLLVSSSSAWAETTKRLSTGFDYSTGKYGGSTSTDILYIPITGKIQTDKLFLKLTVPYITVTSAGNIVIPGTGIFKIIKAPGTTKTKTTVTTESGLGDVIAAAGYTVFENGDLMLDLVGNIKFGTADPDKYLGTGKNDYSAQLDGYYRLNTTTFFATAGYKILGAPAGTDVNNIAYGTLGISQKTGNTSNVGVMMDAAQSTTAYSPGISELTAFVANNVTKSLKIQANLMNGFSDSSPDMSGGIMLTGWF